MIHIKTEGMSAHGRKETRSQTLISGPNGLWELTNFHRWVWTTRNWKLTKKPIATSLDWMDNYFSGFPCSVPLLGVYQMLCVDVHHFMFICFFHFWHPNDHLGLPLAKALTDLVSLVTFSLTSSSIGLCFLQRSENSWFLPCSRG